jgi:lipopolysaccharide export system protein LptC
MDIPNKLRAWLPLLPLALLLLASYWLSQQVQPLLPISSEQRHDVDYVIDKLTTTTLDESGQPRRILSANKMWHYPDDNTTYLQLPLLTSFFADRPPGYMSAQTGKLSNKGEDVFLYENVQIVRPASDNLGEQQFQTNYLHAAPERDWADTDHPVLMTGRKSTISAIGMELDNRARTVVFLSQVNATHEPLVQN